MPPVKGNLAATQAILSLFLDGPDTLRSVRRRLRQEYADARWSRTIVDSSIPALVAQGLLGLIETGAKPGDSLFEITEQGVSEFKKWMRESPRAPAPIREPLQLWIEHSTPDELPALLAVIRESETAVGHEIEVAKRRFDAEWRRGRFGPADSSDWNGRIRYAIFGDKVLYWNHRLERLKHLRKILKGDRDKHRRTPAEGHRGDHAG
jgi:DNA-binding PadR family transcriptional regulator